MRLSHRATGRIRKQAVFLGETARAVWHHAGARVARLRCPILRHGEYNIPHHPGGCKALNASKLDNMDIDFAPTLLDKSPK